MFFFSRLHSFFKVLSQIHNFVSCKFHVKCNLIFTGMMTNPKYVFYRSKLLNETHISLNEDVFPLNKKVKYLSEFSDFLLPGVLSIYLS